MSASRTIEHPSFGVLHETDPKYLPDCYVGSFETDGARFDLRVSPDGSSVDETRDFAAYIFDARESWIEKAKRDVGRGLIDKYNDSWTGGRQIDVEVFTSKIRVSSLQVLGAGCLTIMFKDGGLFGGHSLVVTYFDLTHDLTTDLESCGDVSLFG